jgi:hypothetical protein
MKETILNLIKRIFALLFAGFKGLVRLVLGEENEDLAKKLLIAAAVAFVAICTGKSLHALSKAKRKAARKR